MSNNNKSEIRYVCLSDMHLGEEDSLLTNLQTAKRKTDPDNPSPVMVKLVECLKHLILENNNDTKPILVLNGDILELALTTTNEAAMVFERFMELIMSPEPEGNLFEKIIYIPGNHDHHLWEIARETQYANYIANNPGRTKLELPRHYTNSFKGPVPAYFLKKLIERVKQRNNPLNDLAIDIAYPNFGNVLQNNKCVVFHHGHFIESIYFLMSTLKTLFFPDSKIPEVVQEIEAENFAWIDFFWSAMGRSGVVGQDVELIYEKMGDKEQLKKLLSNLAGSLAEKYDLPGWGDAMEAKFLEWIFNYLVNQLTDTERSKTDRPLSDEAREGLTAYMIGPLHKQIKGEKIRPSEFTFILGHTHKPFQEDMSFKGYEGGVNVYNTGGWVVETADPEPLHGGAIVLVDENLDAVSLRMYNESADQDGSSVKVEESLNDSDTNSDFYNQISEMVDPSVDPWKSFSVAVDIAVRVRAKHLRARINKES